MPKKNEKMYLSEKNLLVFLLEEYGTLSSSSIPQWLLDINQGRVSRKYFSNADKYRNRCKVNALLENVLTSLWLKVTVESTSEMILDEFKFDEARQCYIDTVRQRMSLVSMLDKVISIGVIVREFLILTDEVVNIAVCKAQTDISPLQEGISKMIEMLNHQNLDKRDLN
jgi:hypothetical protein